MNPVQRKIHSQTGASIMAALLLFLVCTILASVIIASSTAAAGRMSQMTKTDQRYYAVTSASEFIKDQLDGEDRCVTVVVQSRQSPSGVLSSTYYVEKPLDEISKTLDLVPANTNASNSLITLCANLADGDSRSITMQLDGEEDTKADVTIQKQTNGNLKVTVAREDFSQELFFSASKSEGSLTQEKLGDTTTSYTTTTYRWLLTSIQTNAAPTPAPGP